MTIPAEKADALVIFGATGDLAKKETFPALVGLAERGVLDMPVIGVAKSGWGLDQFRGIQLANGAVNTLRFRVNPAARVSVTVAGRKQGAGWQPQLETLSFAEQPASDMRPYDRLIGAALAGERDLFSRQDTVEEAWRVVDPVLDDVVPVHSYARGSWGPKEADALLPDGDTWDYPLA
jgi:glucose-6-phosphate 1-dehydrogenase